MTSPTLVADLVSRAMRDHAKPIVLGRDCTIAVGVLAGLLRHFPDLGLIHLDGDVDLNTRAETTSGIFDDRRTGGKAVSREGFDQIDLASLAQLISACHSSHGSLV